MKHMGVGYCMVLVDIGEETCRLVQVSRVNRVGAIFTLKGYGGSMSDLQGWADDHCFRILKQHGPNKCFQVMLKRVR